MGSTLILVIGSSFILVGVSTGTFFCYRIFQGTKSTRWPFVIGELESTDLKEVIYKGRDRSGARRLGEKMEHPIAKTTYVKTRGIWKVYWQRADLKWHRYDPDAEVQNLEDFLAVVERDEGGCFYG